MPTGLTSIIRQDLLEAICRGQVQGLPSWMEAQVLLLRGNMFRQSMKHPFLFAGEVLSSWSSLRATSNFQKYAPPWTGRVVDSEAASVYSLTKSQRLVGLLVSSEAAS